LEVQAGDDHKRPDGPENIRQEYRGTIIPCIRHRVRQNVADGIENKSANCIWSICTRVRLHQNVFKQLLSLFVQQFCRWVSLVMFPLLAGRQSGTRTVLLHATQTPVLAPFGNSAARNN
jgi:hypothetical protein